MSITIRDQVVPGHNGSLGLPLGQLPRGKVLPPQPVADHVAREKVRLPHFYTPAFEKLTLDDLTLAYYYEGVPVAYRSVPDGVEVLAVGADEIGQLVQSVPPERRPDVSIKQP
jgi:hypothetical protein